MALLGVRAIPHGTVNGYKHHKCRCVHEYGNVAVSHPICNLRKGAN